MRPRHIVLTDVTAMAGDAVCVAGIDLSDGATVRLNDPQPTLAMLARMGGLSVAEVIEVRCEPLSRVIPPHVEDHRWDPASVRDLGRLRHDELESLLRRQRFDSIVDAFGEPCHQGTNENHGWRPGAGARSLANIAARWVRLERIGVAPRVALVDGSGAHYRGIPFQDLVTRAHRDTCEPCNDAWFRNAKQEFDGDDCIVRVGLTPPCEERQPVVCWLQVTNILARPRQHFL
jgi:hypothetical protein